MYRKSISILISCVVFTMSCGLALADCPSADLTGDCWVDFEDFAVMARQWLSDCNNTPSDPFCFHKWQPEPPMLIARDQFTGGVINGKIYVFGGNGNPDGINLKSAEVYDPATDWSNIADNNHNGGWGVEELTGAVVDSNLYVFGAWGGIGPSGNYGTINFVEKYNPNTNTWTSLTSKPTPVSSACAAVYNSEIYLFGGVYDYEGKGEPNFYDVVEAYDPNADTWRFVTNMPRLLTGFGLATLGNEAYIIGGYLLNEDRMTGEVMTFNFQTELWDTNCCEPLPDDRVRAFPYSHTVPVVDGEIFLIGGIEGNMASNWPSSKVDIYNTNTNSWQVGPSLPLPLADYLPLMSNGKIYVLGGDNGLDYLNRAKSEVISLSVSERYAPEGMVFIPTGTFQMGDSFSEGETDELPIHAVLIDSFFMGKYEVTNQQYCEYLNDANSLGQIKVVSGVVYASYDDPCGYPYCNTHSYDASSQIDYSGGTFSVMTKGGRDMSNDPMVEVSWYGAAAYCNWRSSQDGYEHLYDPCDSNWPCDFSKGYRLPTEAEWEYAARGGLSGKRFPWGDTISHIQANYEADPCSWPYDVNPTEGHHPDWDDGIFPYTSVVGSFASNGYGLYDMAGNVWEWCNDWYDPNYYTWCKDICGEPCPNPTGPDSGTYHFQRGASFTSWANGCRSANRAWNEPDDLLPNVGFRVVLDLN